MASLQVDAVPEYDDTIQPQSGDWCEITQSKLHPYFPKADLKKAVDLAILLNRPLLLEGEPGSGKSKLAYHLVYSLSKKYTQQRWRFRLWNVQSNSKASDGFYIYDYLGRLQAAQLVKVGVEERNNDPADPEKFVEYGPLGLAFTEHDCQTVVLIDEIDKADAQFANDLLLSIEEQRFEVKELRKSNPHDCWHLAKADQPPIIIITSNQERSLPAAFLRRCLYHYIEFPDKGELTQIINARFQTSPAEVVDAAIERFLKLRSQMDEDKGESGKKVGTSELIDWFQVLNRSPSDRVLELLSGSSLPFPSTLLKSREDLSDYATS
jgi:MoxR-like ATPase